MCAAAAAVLYESERGDGERGGAYDELGDVESRAAVAEGGGAEVEVAATRGKAGLHAL